jgi:hypothetical protein
MRRVPKLPTARRLIESRHGGNNTAAFSRMRRLRTCHNYVSFYIGQSPVIGDRLMSIPHEKEFFLTPRLQLLVIHTDMSRPQLFINMYLSSLWYPQTSSHLHLGGSDSELTYWHCGHLTVRLMAHGGPSL